MNSAVSRVIPVSRLEAEQRGQMFDLMSRFFSIERSGFEADLACKESVLWLEEDSRCRGFSTLLTIERNDYRAVYSGDTIVCPEARSRPDLSRLWAQEVFRLAHSDPRPLYWFLICSGFRTYRFLATFFRQFYPTFREPTPPNAQARLNELANLLFGQRYQQGVVVCRHPSPLKDSTVPCGRKNDPHVRFFLANNPGHRRGEELACLARVEKANLTRAGLRMLGG